MESCGHEGEITARLIPILKKETGKIIGTVSRMLEAAGERELTGRKRSPSTRRFF
jgi:hypothetical protein